MYLTAIKVREELLDTQTKCCDILSEKKTIEEEAARTGIDKDPKDVISWTPQLEFLLTGVDDRS